LSGVPPDASLAAGLEEESMEGAFHYAGFWWRFVAALIDGIIVWAGSIAVGATIAAIGIFGDFTDDFGTGLLGLVDIVGVWLYFALQESSGRQATVGKRCCGIVVTDLDGNRISFGRATGRYFGKFISSLILMVGYMMAGWTRRKQALHDIMAECLVLRRKPETILLPGATT
jgi:uncharacterized RDD family membrane protein YckC